MSQPDVRVLQRIYDHVHRATVVYNRPLMTASVPEMRDAMYARLSRLAKQQVSDRDRVENPELYYIS